MGGIIDMKYNKGQISLMIVIITAGATILASVIGGWTTANTRVLQIDTKVQVIEERENNHYQELKEKLDSIDNKLDKLIELQ